MLTNSNGKLSPDSLGRVVLALEYYCGQLDFQLVIDPAYTEVYLLDPTNGKDILNTQRDSLDQALYALSLAIPEVYDVDLYYGDENEY